ncbi:16S rRNA (cytosine(967)-C(5))-methyltransferase RsmB [Faecalibaculum rodentium]|jgi:16S rRNA (cytosine967-C5)-methyltransferase|uniref:16S rRNA (cytosine(967)-C(5))-methyltransferase RsmB n=4 Tax=Faecalibaculum rodentium TaxID=1702221 RepID=UPI002570BB9F|nr:16S rRNA (cytosine(967)-C(5))-methyltransferase RsmB [Faecalibaculum rodentium]
MENKLPDMRAWIYDALCAVILKGTYSNLYLKDHLDELPENQRPLATRIFYGTIQNWGLCDYVISKHTDRTPDPKIRILLAMTIYQIIFLKKIPDYAAVDAAVKLAHKRFGKASGYVNGVLRSVLRDKVKLPSDTLERLSVRYSIPLWLIRLWENHYGLEKAEQMAKTSNAVLPVYVRRNPRRIGEEEFFADPEIERMDADMGRFTGSSAARHPFYRQGRMSVQDPGSFEIVKFLDVQDGESVLDVCAAPGTKSMAIAERLDSGAVDASDVHEHRVELIKTDARRLHLKNVHASVRDARNLSDAGLYDRILCDVPCTGYGVLARKPDIKLKLKPETLDSLLPLQAEILEEAAAHLKPDGKLVYSTCTLDRKENEKQVEKFLDCHPDWQLEEEQTVFPDETRNGFYMARLSRREQSKAADDGMKQNIQRFVRSNQASKFNQ